MSSTGHKGRSRVGFPKEIAIELKGNWVFLAIPRPSFVVLLQYREIVGQLWRRSLVRFKSFGWSDIDVFAVFRALPSTLHASEFAVRQKVNFYMEQLGSTPAYLVTYPAL